MIRCVLALSLVASEAVSQAPPVERVTSELVLIEAYVTDERGLSIEGLRPEDFVLTIDGLVKPIASVEFLTVAPGSTLAGASTNLGSTPGRVEPPGSPLSRRLVLFFDDATSLPPAMAEARSQAAEFLASDLAPSDEVALVSFDGTLRVLHDFTSDARTLRQVLTDDLRHPERRRQPAIDFNRQAREIGSVLFDDLVETGARMMQAARIANGYAAQASAALRLLLAGLRSLADSLAAEPGYKAIVLLGDGVPQNTASEYFSGLGGNPQGAGFMSVAERKYQARLDRILKQSLAITKANDLSQEVQHMREALAADRVTLSTIQTAGGIAARRTDALKTTTRDTGGFSAFTADIRGALRNIESRSRAFYILAYVPEGPPDGRYHAVTLRLRRERANLSWRRGFMRLNPAAAQNRFIRAALDFPQLNTGLGLDVTLVSNSSAPAGQTHDVMVHLASDAISYLPEGGHRTVRLLAGIVASDASGSETLRDVREVEVAIPVTRSTGRPSLNLVSHVHLPAGRQTITVVVSDRNSGITSAARFPVDSHPAPDETISGLGIYSLAEESLWVDIHAGDAASDANTAPPPSPAIAAGNATVGPGTRTPTTYSIGPALKGAYAPGEPLVCRFRLLPDDAVAARSFRISIRAGGETICSRDAVPAKSGPPWTMEARLPVKGLGAGDYVLAVQEMTPSGVVDRAETLLKLTSPVTPTTQ